jgi:hypothetical protein
VLIEFTHIRTGSNKVFCEKNNEWFLYQLKKVNAYYHSYFSAQPISVGVVTQVRGWTTEDTLFDSRQGQDILFFSEKSRPATKPT